MRMLQVRAASDGVLQETVRCVGHGEDANRYLRFRFFRFLLLFLETQLLATRHLYSRFGTIIFGITGVHRDS